MTAHEFRALLAGLGAITYGLVAVAYAVQRRPTVSVFFGLAAVLIFLAAEVLG